MAKQDHPDWKLNVKEFAEGGRAPTVKELRAKQPQPGSPAQKDLELKEGIQSLMAGIVSLNDLGPKVCPQQAACNSALCSFMHTLTPVLMQIGNGADGHVFSIYDHVAVKVTHINTIKHEADMYAACETHGLSGPQGAVPTFYGYGKLNHGELKDSKLGWLAVEKIKVRFPELGTWIIAQEMAILFVPISSNTSPKCRRKFERCAGGACGGAGGRGAGDRWPAGGLLCSGRLGHHAWGREVGQRWLQPRW